MRQVYIFARIMIIRAKHFNLYLHVPWMGLWFRSPCRRINLCNARGLFGGTVKRYRNGDRAEVSFLCSACRCRAPRRGFHFSYFSSCTVATCSFLGDETLSNSVTRVRDSVKESTMFYVEYWPYF
jgi:hypothetical protein